MLGFCPVAGSGRPPPSEGPGLPFRFTDDPVVRAKPTVTDDPLLMGGALIDATNLSGCDNGNHSPLTTAANHHTQVQVTRQAITDSASECSKAISCAYASKDAHGCYAC